VYKLFLLLLLQAVMSLVTKTMEEHSCQFVVDAAGRRTKICKKVNGERFSLKYAKISKPVKVSCCDFLCSTRLLFIFPELCKFKLTLAKVKSYFSAAARP